MEEREALKRQIERLQNLINNHKSIHGNAPSAVVDQLLPGQPISARGSSGRGASYVRHQQSYRGRPYGPQPSGGKWRKTYSLSNKAPQLPTEQNAASASSSGPASSSLLEAAGTPHSAYAATVSQGYVPEEPLAPRRPGAFIVSAEPKSNAPCGRTADLLPPVAAARKEDGVVLQTALPAKATGAPATARGQGSQKPDLSAKTGGSEVPPPPPLALPHSPSAAPTPVTPATYVPRKLSKFTWVKSQAGGESGVGRRLRLTSLLPPPAGTSSSSHRAAHPDAAVALGSAVARRHPGKRPHRRLSPAAGAPKTSKYTWVSATSTGGSQAKQARKNSSPWALAAAQRAPGRMETPRAARMRKAAMSASAAGAAAAAAAGSLGNRYRWKAVGQSGLGAGAGVSGTSSGTRRGCSVFHWTSERSAKGVKGGLGVAPLPLSRACFLPPPPSSSSSSSPGGFKLRSRMKIIRRSVSSSSSPGSERRTPPLAGSRQGWRGRGRAPASPRGTPSRDLVSFGRHKLRRLSAANAATSPKTGPASAAHLRGLASPRVFRSRYKMVTRLGAVATQGVQYGHALSWRAKRIQTARSLLQSRLRASQDTPPSPQHWRGRSMRWIGGSLYRVSANKLSRTAASSMSINRTGRWSAPPQDPHTSSPSGRLSHTRHVASRVVQRSISIIRQARHKKQPRQYCMYYNRFGKCNRGNDCPYIHDPDKVAVCTRFLRGTCKQADGTCPFSHKVAKEKMPVCSYFLKGVCNNSSCPYSHVYVSHKAAVCQDFIKGYCPQGEKCKKKHTLVCPDFSKTGSCPQGIRCKLQHRQRAKRSAPSGPSNTPRTPRARDSKRPRLSVAMPPAAHVASADPGTPTADPSRLPSFISLSSSPEEADTPDTYLALQPKAEKKLQIKPRL